MMIDPVVLEGRHVRLEPLSSLHRPGLCKAIADGELWQLFFTMVPHPDALDAFFANAASEHVAGKGLAFATIDKASGEVAGSTRYMQASLADKRVEIGFTFLGKSWQRTVLNTEAKLLMLTHAFEVLQLNRVEFMTDYLNTPSRRAILRLGAKEEGLLRNHKILPDGRSRDTMVYSIIRPEWGGVKQNLEYKLGRG